MMRTSKAPSAPAELTVTQPDESDHTTRDAGAPWLSTCPSEKRTSICKLSDATSGAPWQ